MKCQSKSTKKQTKMVARGGIEPPTRGFSIRNVEFIVFINQCVTGASDAPFAVLCTTVQD